MTFRSEVPAIGDRVRVKDAYSDAACTLPLLGVVKDVFRRPDWGNAWAFVVMFDTVSAFLPPGGEFTGDRLALIA